MTDAPDAPDGPDEPGPAPAARAAAIHEHLAATRELPVERAARRWIGEAEAVAGDVAGADVDPDVARDRIARVADLLANVEATGHPAADERVAAARELAAGAGTDG